MFQESFLFASQRAREHRAGDTGADAEGVVAARRRSPRADTFIRELPTGYDTVVGERGHDVVGRPAPAGGARPSAGARAADPDPGRRDILGRSDDRGRHPGRPAPRARHHADRRGLPPVDDPPGRPRRCSWRTAASRRTGSHDQLLATQPRLRRDRPRLRAKTTPTRRRPRERRAPGGDARRGCAPGSRGAEERLGACSAAASGRARSSAAACG